MSEIIDFQAGRKARIRGLPRDGRRNADWLRGWDIMEATAQCWREEYAKRNQFINSMEIGRG